MADIETRYHLTRAFPQGDPFFRSHKHIINFNDHLAGSSETVFDGFVVVIELNSLDVPYFPQVNQNSVILSFVKRYKPHVAVVSSIVFVVEQLLQCSVVLAVAWNGVHITRDRFHYCSAVQVRLWVYSDGDWLTH